MLNGDTKNDKCIKEDLQQPPYEHCRHGNTNSRRRTMKRKKIDIIDRNCGTFKQQ
jgi:hypothetical protein